MKSKAWQVTGEVIGIIVVGIFTIFLWTILITNHIFKTEYQNENIVDICARSIKPLKSYCTSPCREYKFKQFDVFLETQRLTPEYKSVFQELCQLHCSGVITDAALLFSYCVHKAELYK